MSTADDLRPRTGGKRERTRVALVAAALEVIADKGFAGASLDAIAVRAGMTRGAIYSNFSGRAELLLEAIGSKGLNLAPRWTPGAPLKTHLREMAQALVAALPAAQGEARFLAEFHLYALGDPDLRSGVAALYTDGFGQMARMLALEHGDELAIAPRPLAVILQSLALGFVYQFFLSPDEVTEPVIVAALDAVADGVVRTRAEVRDTLPLA